MIRIDEITFSNMFSYGEDNTFTISPSVTQLSGANGTGKSYLASIIEELFFNKNSRGVKKSAIENRYSDVTGYSCTAKFSIGNTPYTLEKKVATTTKLVLKERGVDISGHTTTQTYKKVEQLLGLDFQTFTKLVYQSITSSLDFLVATDANRKKFLVTLLGLEHYVEAEKKIKEETKESKSSVASIERAVANVSSWIDSCANDPTKLLEESFVPEEDTELQSYLIKRNATYSNLALNNSIVSKNIAQKQALAKTVKYPEVPKVDLTESKLLLKGKEALMNQAKADVRNATSEVRKVEGIKESCHVCGS